MNSTIVFKGESMTITHHSPQGYLEIRWAGLTKSSEYREAWNIALEIAQETR